jgi:hypothetical protein
MDDAGKLKVTHKEFNPLCEKKIMYYDDQTIYHDVKPYLTTVCVSSHSHRHDWCLYKISFSSVCPSFVSSMRTFSFLLLQLVTPSFHVHHSCGYEYVVCVIFYFYVITCVIDTCFSCLCTAVINLHRYGNIN